MSRKALIVWGGWEGHEPQRVAELFRELLTQQGFDVEISNTLNGLDDGAKLRSLSLIVPHWTMGQISPIQLGNVLEAVRGGVGLAGCHGGLCDAFRDQPDWHFMTGGQWVAHPGNDAVRYAIRMTDVQSPITQGIEPFEVLTEQYYLHVDPAVNVLATTRFPVADGPHVPNGPVEMPVIWTKRFGAGRVYYNALGHTAAVLAAEPVRTLVRRGFAWAARG